MSNLCLAPARAAALKGGLPAGCILWHDYRRGSAADLAPGNVHPMTLYGGIVLTGAGMPLDGATQYAQHNGTSPALDAAVLAGEWTLACRYTSQSTAAYKALAGKLRFFEAGGTPEWGLGNTYATTARQGGSIAATTYARKLWPTTFTTGVEYQLTVVVSGGQLTLYRDGVTSAPVSYTGTCDASAFKYTVGRSCSAAAFYLAGTVASDLFWPRALSAGEVAALYAGGY